MRMVELGEYAVKRGGSVNPAKHPEETFELFSIPAYDSGEADIVLGSEIGSSKKRVEPSDVLLSRIVPHLRRCWVIENRREHRQIASGEWIAFRGDDFHPPYLRHFLLSDPFHAQFMQTVSGVGGSLLRAKPAQVYKIKVPLPPLAEQKRISKILDEADALRAKRRESLAKLDALLQSTFLDMFGDPVENPKGWTTCPLSQVVERLEGGKNVAESKSPTGNRILKVSAVTYGTYRPHESKFLPDDFSFPDSYYVRPGDLLISRANTFELIGATAYVWETPSNMVLSDKIWRFVWRVDANIHPLFFFGLSKIQSFRSEISKRASGTSGSMKNIGKGKLLSIKAPIPPKHLQDAFGQFVTSLKGHSSTLKDQGRELDALFASLQQRAFAGQL